MIFPLIPLIILALFRFWDLDVRPIHHDESVNGWFVDGIFSRGYYLYDPENYHGPLYFYLIALAEKIFGRNLVALRIPAVIFGCLLSFSPLLFRKWMGSRAAWISVAILTVSPALVFFSRYSIHETAFVLSCVTFLYSWLHFREEGRFGRHAALLGISLGLMATLKENFVLFGATIVLSELMVSIHERRLSVRLDRVFFKSVGMVFGIAALLVVVFFTGFFQDGEGLLKFFKAFLKWTETGTKGNGHEKPFVYWLNLMASFEWPALAGLVAVPFLVFFKKGFGRLLAWIGFFLWLIYSMVAYKTPWCGISFFVFLTMAFSLGISELIERPRYRTVLIPALFAGGLFLAYRAYDVAYLKPDQDEHPYIYGQTYHDLMGPIDRILESVKARPDGKEKTRVQVLSAFTWPLPYLFGEIKQTAYFSDGNPPEALDADFLLIDESLLPKHEARIKGSYSREVVRARQWASRMVVFTKKQP